MQTKYMMIQWKPGGRELLAKRCRNTRLGVEVVIPKPPHVPCEEFYGMLLQPPN